ncbi:MAG: MmgE/PrpD family protein, partial [Polyangiaceae bacterium]
AGRIQTFDDTFEDGPVHPGTTSVSTALAVAETFDISGAEFFAAVLAGYETSVRLSIALSRSHYGSGFHNTGTCNTFGACAAAARAAGLDADAVADALGIAGGAAAGLRQYQLDGSMSDSALHAARAAQSGVTAVALQRAGLRGPHGVIDGTWGLLRTMSHDSRPEEIAHALGSRYAFAATSLKPYPSCRFTHGPIDELLALRSRYRLEPQSIESIEIATFRESIDVADRPKIGSPSEAIMSHQYAAARALLDGTVTLEDFAVARIEERPVRALAERVQVVYDSSLQTAYPAAWPHRVTVRCTDGRRLVAESLHPPGSSEVPLDDERVRRKFAELVDPVLGAERRKNVAQLVERLEEVERVSELACALR